LAVTNVPQTVNKLTFDDKQELSIDPRIAGLSGDDPMNIKNIASRESFLDNFAWQTTATPEETLFSIKVSPTVWRESATVPKAYMFPACCMAALPFKYWTGTMRYRFQIVASSFHKGRLRFSYDPNLQSTSGADPDTFNTNYNRIVDISKEQDFTIEIGVGQEHNLISNLRPGITGASQVYGQGSITGSGANGVLTVKVLNELTTPNSTVDNNIEVNVFVSAGDDFEVFAPSDHFQQFTFFPPQSGVESAQAFSSESQATSEPSHPLQWQTAQLGLGEQDLSHVNKVFIGESIASFRPLLKRANLHESVYMRAGRAVNVGTRPAYPFLRGYAPGAVHRTDSATDYNFVNTVLLHWVTNAFQGMRGSVRWKLIPRGFEANTNNTTMYATRISPHSILAFYSASALTDTFLGTHKTAHDAVFHLSSETSLGLPTTGIEGSAVTHGSVNSILEIEVPYYSSDRFAPGKKSRYTFFDKDDFLFKYHVTSDYSNASRLDLWCSTGEDFQVYMWTGLPRMYYEQDPPNPL
jgi:hypothetical protein